MQEVASRLRVPRATGELIIMLNPFSRPVIEDVSHKI